MGILLSMQYAVFSVVFSPTLKVHDVQYLKWYIFRSKFRQFENFWLCSLLDTCHNGNTYPHILQISAAMMLYVFLCTQRQISPYNRSCQTQCHELMIQTFVMQVVGRGDARGAGVMVIGCGGGQVTVAGLDHQIY